jgi:DNA integrity scanning protein DisA with diadenylate cyclase activity
LIFQQKKIIQISQKLFRNNICVLIITNIKFCTLKHVILKLSKSLCQKIKKFQSAKLMKESTMQELHNHVEEGLGRNLQQRCSFVLQQAVETTQREMTGILRLFKL